MSPVNTLHWVALSGSCVPDYLVKPTAQIKCVITFTRNNTCGYPFQPRFLQPPCHQFATHAFALVVGVNATEGKVPIICAIAGPQVLAVGYELVKDVAFCGI